MVCEEFGTVGRGRVYCGTSRVRKGTHVRVNELQSVLVTKRNAT